jgi:hypothetical protein
LNPAYIRSKSLSSFRPQKWEQDFREEPKYMASKIDCSVVAVFDDDSEARAAVSELRDAGFNAHNIYVSSESAESATVGGGKVAAPAGPEHRIREWFKAVFGPEEHSHRTAYDTAIAGGKTIVSVDTSESNSSQVSEILESHSAVNVHTDDFGTARSVATPNVYNAGYQGSRSDLLNAREELNTPADQPGSAGWPIGREHESQAAIQGPAVRVYPYKIDKSI